MGPAGDAADWPPSASLDALRLRAELLGRIRRFFAARGVLEVDTPILSAAAATDPHLESFATEYAGPGGSRRLYLQTSPEFAMKRLLAAGSGPIYQVAHAFRQGEYGSRHNPEFTLLEWYRTGCDHHGLMDEVEALVRTLLEGRRPLGAGERLSYAQAFRRHAGVDPLRDDVARLRRRAQEHGIALGAAKPGERDAWLDLLLTHVVEPELGRTGPTFLYDYPPSQAALARVRPDTPPVAERFELYVDGMELANGFHELGDAREQARRFAADLQQRKARGLAEVPSDTRLLAALEAGLPPCAGVALGLDRLLMLAAGRKRLSEVLSFELGRA